MAQHLTARPPPLSSRGARLGPVDATMAKALSKSPEDRFQSTGLFGQALSESILRIPGVSTRQEQAPRTVAAFVGRACRGQAARRRHRPRSRDAQDHAPRGAGRDEGRLPDLLILDTDLPRSASLDFVVGIRSRPEGSRMRVVLVGPSGDTTRWRFGVLGIDCFLAKPLDFAAMVDAIAGLAERAGWKSTAREDDGSASH